MKSALSFAVVLSAVLVVAVRATPLPAKNLTPPPPPPDAVDADADAAAAAAVEEQTGGEKKNSTGGGGYLNKVYNLLPEADTLSTVVGAALGDDNCLKKTACTAGSYVTNVTGKELVLMLMDRWVPSSWQETLTAFKEAAVYGDDCKKQFACATN